MSQEVRLYKLINGEEIVGRLESEEDDFVVLSKVRAMAMQPTGQGQVGIAMLPWMAGAVDEDVKVYRKYILGEPNGGVPKQLENGYLQNTTGLQLGGTSGLNVKQ